jgi:hypothetical protein
MLRGHQLEKTPDFPLNLYSIQRCIETPPDMETQANNGEFPSTSTTPASTTPDASVLPGLKYSLREKKWKIIIWWTLLVLDSCCLQLTLYYALWYDTNLNHNIREFYFKYVGAFAVAWSLIRDVLQCSRSQLPSLAVYRSWNTYYDFYTC